MKTKLSFLLIILVAFQINAQRGLKVAYVDMDYIPSKIWKMKLSFKKANF